MKKASFRLSGQLLATALALPEDARILEVKEVYTFGSSVDFMVTVQSEDLPEVDEGDPIPEIIPTHTLLREKGPREWIEFDWGIK